MFALQQSFGPNKQEDEDTPTLGNELDQETILN